MRTVESRAALTRSTEINYEEEKLLAHNQMKQWVALREWDPWRHWIGGTRCRGLGRSPSAGSTSLQATGFTCLVAQGAWGSGCRSWSNHQHPVYQEKTWTKIKQSQSKKNPNIVRYPQRGRPGEIYTSFLGESLLDTGNWKGLEH